MSQAFNLSSLSSVKATQELAVYGLESQLFPKVYFVKVAVVMAAGEGL